MYGTVSRWRVKDGKQQQLEQVAKELMTGERPAGSQWVAVYKADSDPCEYWVASGWDSREAYTSNSSTPQQDQRFRRLRELMEGDPEWHDGEIVIWEP